jgi:outer membrane lipoprotein SlyB
MMRAVSKWLAALLTAALVAGCAGGGGGMGMGSPAPVEIRQGRVEQITEVPLEHPHQLGVGAVLGAGAGVALGSLIGAGTGRDVAMVIGGLAGAAGGQYAQNRYESKQVGQQVVVRLGNGVLVVVTQKPNPYLRVGQPVYIEGAGQDASVIPR